MKEETAHALVKRVNDKGGYYSGPDSDGDCILDGHFTIDELEALVWCMRNNKWPET